jgi:hypothetical protein
MVVRTLAFVIVRRVLDWFVSVPASGARPVLLPHTAVGLPWPDDVHVARLEVG